MSCLWVAFFLVKQSSVFFLNVCSMSYVSAAKISSGLPNRAHARTHGTTRSDFLVGLPSNLRFMYKSPFIDAYICIYICIKRERERERDREIYIFLHARMPAYMQICICIYLCMYVYMSHIHVSHCRLGAARPGRRTMYSITGRLFHVRLRTSFACNVKKSCVFQTNDKESV